MSSRLARFDRRLMHRWGIERLAGTDEAGRGCLAGPVMVAAVVLPPGLELPGDDDSKRLGPDAREAAFRLIRAHALSWSALAISAGEVDRRNVLQASLWGMARAVRRLRLVPQMVLVDGPHLPDALPAPAHALIKGDGRSQSVAAASIVAKVLRDRVMRVWDRHYPGYGFSSHVGYPTPTHRRELERRGATPLHRSSFAPVARRLAQTRLEFSGEEQAEA